MQTQAVFGSPSGGGSPGSPGGEKVGRAAAKKVFRDEVDEIIQAVKLLPTLYKEFSKLQNANGKLNVAFTNDQGQARQYQVGKKEINEMNKLIVSRLKALPTLAFTLNKTRRRTAPNSGFLAPAQFSPEIVGFFANANVGDTIDGKFVLKTDKAGNTKSIPDSGTLRVLQPVTRLNNYLYFTQQSINGQANPLYGVISPGTLTPLFALHAYYSKMQNPNDATRLSASPEMRNALAAIMQQTIQNDVQKLTDKGILTGNQTLVQQAQQAAPLLIQAINNPNIALPTFNPDGSVAQPAPSQFQSVGPDGSLEKDEIFNPNYFLYAHFSKLISNGKIHEDRGGLSEAKLSQARQLIPNVYGNIDGVAQGLQAIQGTTPQGQVAAYENAVLQAQQLKVALARAAKNQVQSKDQRTKKAAQKAAEKQAAALQQQPQQFAQQQFAQQQGFGGFPVAGQGF
jgi:hypothetical protein